MKKHSILASLIILGIIWSGSITESFAEDNPDLNDIDQLKAEIDSLRDESEKLQKEKDSLDRISNSEVEENNEQRIIHFRAQRKKRNQEFIDQMKDIKDTIQILTRESARAFLGSFVGQKRNTRERGYGGGLGPVIGFYSVNLKPVKRFIDDHKNFSPYHFNIDGSYENFLLMGGIGYGGIGNGLRIGGGGRGGSRTYTAKGNGDTTVALKICVGFGGVLLEKCLVLGKKNIYFGGMIGGGGIEIFAEFSEGPFTNVNNDEDNTINFEAGFMLLELHGGFTYTFLNWLHMGFELSLPSFISPGGFKNRAGFGMSDGFMTANPGFRIRIMFGNIG